LENHWVFIGH